jgi:benzoate-CoA ligase family protein
MTTKLNIPERFNVATYFIDRNLEHGYGERTAIVYQDDEITYSEVWQNVNRAGNLLHELGVTMEQRVLMAVLDSPAFAYTFFGAIKIGAVPVPVNTLLRPAEFAYVLHDSRAVILVISAPLISTLREVIDHSPYLRCVLVIGSEGEFPQPRYQSFDEGLAATSSELTPANTSCDDVAFWLYTSGTTGYARAAVHLQHDMVYCAELYARPILHMTAEDRTFSVAKLFFAYGLGNALYFPFSVGASTVLYPGRPEPTAIFEVVRRYRPTLFFGVPTAYAAMLYAVEHGSEANFSSTRLAVSAGEPLPASIYNRWYARFGIEILDGIGSTEVLHIFISNRAGEVRPGSSGKVVPGYAARILDEDGREVGVGEIGNLLISGDSICAYYWNKHEATKRTIIGEWIRTGDKYHVDEDGFFWYDGRSDDMLKVSGQWVSPVEVEGVLIAHPAVLECAVVGVRDEAGLTKPVAYVVLKDGYRPSAELMHELQEFVKGQIAPHKYPRSIAFVDELPKTATGKIQRFKLRQQEAPVA